MDAIEKWRRKFWTTIMTTTVLILVYYYKYIYKEPCMTSILSGEEWMKDVLTGHPIRSINIFRMESKLFMRLCRDLSSRYGLKRSRRMSIIEKVGIFLYTLALGASNRTVGERFQRSGDTISRAFHDVLDAISSRTVKGLAYDILRPKDPTFSNIPPQIEHDERYMPFFKNCIGCIDGTHVQACIPESDQLLYRGRKGIPTFNVMAACDFDMCFTFVSAGWEGSAHDTRVFRNAIDTPELKFPKPPEGKYYLVDKGYPDTIGYLVPYPKLRYHQSQYQNEPPQNAQEAFNRAHSSLRSCIERSFGVLKQRWKILCNMPQFSVETQIRVIVATFALHNYIRVNSPNDLLFQVLEKHPDYVPSDELSENGASTSNEGIASSSSGMKEIRDHIAAALWHARRH